MKAHVSKVPNPTELELLLADGQTPSEIAATCGAHVTTVRKALRRAGLQKSKNRQPSIDGPRSRAPQAIGGPKVELLSDRIVYPRRVTGAGSVGSAWKRVPLALVSLHVEQLREDRRC